MALTVAALLLATCGLVNCGGSEAPAASDAAAKSDAGGSLDAAAFDARAGDVAEEIDGGASHADADCHRDASGVPTDGLCCMVQSDCEPGPGPWFVCCVNGTCLDCMR